MDNKIKIDITDISNSITEILDIDGDMPNIDVVSGMSYRLFEYDSENTTAVFYLENVGKLRSGTSEKNQSSMADDIEYLFFLVEYLMDSDYISDMYLQYDKTVNYDAVLEYKDHIENNKIMCTIENVSKKRHDKIV